MKIINGTKTTIDLSGDFGTDSYWRNWSNEDVFTCLHYTQSGLVCLNDPNGELVLVQKERCKALKNK